MVAQILDEMVAIRHLSRMRQDPAHCIRKSTGPIPADHLNFWMRGEPRHDHFSSTIWQELKGLARLNVNENRSVRVSTPQRSGKGNGVTTIPSPKNRTGEFLHIRLKP